MTSSIAPMSVDNAISFAPDPLLDVTVIVGRERYPEPELVTLISPIIPLTILPVSALTAVPCSPTILLPENLKHSLINTWQLTQSKKII